MQWREIELLEAVDEVHQLELRRDGRRRLPGRVRQGRADPRRRRRRRVAQESR